MLSCMGVKSGEGKLLLEGMPYLQLGGVMTSKGVDVSSGKLIFGNLGVLEKVGMSGWKNVSVDDLWIAGVSTSILIYIPQNIS